jgi:hypothetical protein
VVAALMESVETTTYCRKLKQRLKAESLETVTNCHGLKIKAADDKLHVRVTVRHGLKLESL